LKSNLKQLPIFPDNQPELHKILSIVEQQQKMMEFLVKTEEKRHGGDDKTMEQGFWFFKHKEIFLKLKEYIKKLEDNFDDPYDKIQYLGVIKDFVLQLKKDLNKETYNFERKLCIVIYDSIHKAKAEQLDEIQLKVLKDSLETLFKGNCTRNDLRVVEKNLRSSGLNWIIGY
jgi:hypothetical protein